MSEPERHSLIRRWLGGTAFAISTLALLATGPGGPEWRLSATITGPPRPAKADEVLLLSFDTSHRPFVLFENARGESRQIACAGGRTTGQFTCVLPPGASIRSITASARCVQGCSDKACLPPKSAYLRVTSESRSAWTRTAHLDARGTFAAIGDASDGHPAPSIEMRVDASGADVEMSVRAETLAHEPLQAGGGGVTPMLYGGTTPDGLADGTFAYLETLAFSSWDQRPTDVWRLIAAGLMAGYLAAAAICWRIALVIFENRSRHVEN